MKQSSNNEVDILLRSLARQRRDGGVSNASPAGNGGGSLSDHLDADELNSYAEGVLPAAARARYTEHLADCDDCRGLVVGLSQAAGAGIRQPIPESVGKKFLAEASSIVLTGRYPLCSSRAGADRRDGNRSDGVLAATRVQRHCQE